MDRRLFLRAAAVTATGGTLLLALGGIVEAETTPGSSAARRELARYRGTRDGKVFVSTDGGRTWTLHTDFGPDLTVVRVYRTSRNRVIAKLRYERFDFRLVLGRDERTWRTV